MKNKIPLIAYWLLIPFFLMGQKYQNIESGGIRIDPEWTQTARVTGFSWGYDVIYDKKGNIYSTGYVRSQIAESDKKSGPPPCPTGISCQDVTFLSKRNEKGELIWRQYIFGSTRVLKLVLDKNGFVNMVGSIYSRKVALSSTGSEPIFLENGDTYTGIFMCKYDENGVVKQSKVYNEGKRPTALNFLIDEKENLYVSGYTEYRPYNKRSEPHASYLFLKFDKNWNLDWKISGDTIGRSVIHGIALDGRSNIIFTGMYTNYMDLGEIRKTDDYHQKPFIGKITNKGKVKWISEDISKINSGVGFHLACDSRDNAYVTVNTSYSHAYLSKVNKNGKTEWMHKIERSATFEDLVITEDDRIFICGEGQGALFPSNGAFLYSYKSVSGTDGFIAEYDTEGVLKWLKAFGDKGTEYCRSIDVQGNKVVAFGSYNNTITFKEVTLPKGSHFWYGEFSLEKLENTTVKAPPVAGKIIIEKPKEVGCFCTQEVKQLSYASRVNDFATYEEVEKLAGGWTYAGKENFYKKLYYKGFYNSYTRESNTASMTLIAPQSVSFMHPDGTIAINMSPCKSNLTYTEVPIMVYYELPIKRTYPGFEYEEFGKTTQEYMDVLASYFNFYEYEILYKVILNGELNDVEAFVNDVNIRYGWNIKILSDDEKPFIESFVTVLEENEMDVYEFVLNEFVLTEKTEHLITEDEKKKLTNIFSLWQYGNGFDVVLNEIIQPNVRVILNTENIGIDIDQKIIRRWNNIKNEPLLENGEYVKTTILGKVKEVRFETKRGLQASVKEICATRSEITGTGILFDFTQGAVELGAVNKEAFLTDYSWQRQSEKASEAVRNRKPLTDEMLKKFTGLVIANPRYMFDFQGNVLNATGNQLLANNKIIIGSMTLPIMSSNGEQIVLQGNDKNISTTYFSLKTYFETKGFDEVQLTNQGLSILVEFKKMNW